MTTSPDHSEPPPATQAWVPREPQTFMASNGIVLERSDDCVACGEGWRWSGLNADRLCWPCYRADQHRPAPTPSAAQTERGEGRGRGDE